MKEKQVLSAFVFAFLGWFWLSVVSLHSEPLYGADLSRINLRIEGTT